MHMDDLGLPKPSFGPGKTPMKGPGKQDSAGNGVRTAGKPPATEKEPPPGQTPAHAETPARQRPRFLFEDDDFLDTLGLDSDPEGNEEAQQPARSKMDELLGQHTVGKVMEKPVMEKLVMGEQKDSKLDEKSQKQPGKEEGWDEDDFVFGEYRPTVASLPKGQLSRRQSVRFSAENISEEKPPPATQRVTQRNRSGGGFLGLKDELVFDFETERKPDPPEEDWLTSLLAKKKEEVKAKERNAKASEGPGKGLDPGSPIRQPATSSGTLQQAAAPQDKAASTSGSGQPLPWLSTAPPASSHAPEAAKGDSSRDTGALASFPGEQKTQGPAPLTQVTTPTAHLPAAPQLQTEAPALGLMHEGRPQAPTAHPHKDALDCQAALLSAQVHVAQLESQVRMLEEERTQQKLLLESRQQWHQDEIDYLESSHRKHMKLMEETYEQREKMLWRLKEQLEAQLLLQSQEAERARTELKQQHMLELERVRELQRVSVQEMHKEHEEQLQLLGQLKDQEIKAVTSAMSHTRSLNSITGKIENFFSALHDFSQQMEATHRTTSQELATEVQQWDKKLQALQDRVLQQQREMEEELRRFREVVVKMESRLSEQTRLLEQEQCKVTAVESLQHSLEEQQRAVSHQLSKEQAELERTKAELKIRSRELEAKEEQLARDREQLEETKWELRLEKEKMDRAALHIRQREEEVKDLMKERLSLAQQRRQLQELREELALATEQDIRAPAKGVSSTWLPPRTAAPQSWALSPDFRPPVQLLPQYSGGGEAQAMAGSSPISTELLLLLKLRAQQDHTFLENEQLFLETLKKASHKTSD